MKSKNLSENILRIVKAKGYKYIELDNFSSKNIFREIILYMYQTILIAVKKEQQVL